MVLFDNHCKCDNQHGTMILVMEDLTSYMNHRPRFWLNLLMVLEATFIGDTPSSILQVSYQHVNGGCVLLLYINFCVAVCVSFVRHMDCTGQIFTVSFNIIQ